MGLDDQKILDALDTSARELQQRLDQHCCLVAHMLEGAPNGRLPGVGQGPKRTLLLKEALKEAIDVLEESRKAFKSKKLEALRRKLTRVLIDAA